MSSSEFPKDRLSEIKRHPENFRLLERVPEPDVNGLPLVMFEKHDAESVIPVIFLDTETTGLDFGKNKIIELAMIRCTYSLDRQILLSVDAVYDEFEDPQEPISEEITALTGITDEMVMNKSFNEADVESMLEGDPVVIAHNAGFDRPFFDQRFKGREALTSLRWGCSLYEIDWFSMGFHGSKLEFLLGCIGRFYEAHRAVNDCFALGFLLQQRNDALRALMHSVFTPVYRYDFDFGERKLFLTRAQIDHLKGLGFRWDAENKVRYYATHSAEVLNQIRERIEHMFGQSSITQNVRIYTARERYKSF